MLYHPDWKKLQNGARNGLRAEQMQHFHQEILNSFFKPITSVSFRLNMVILFEPVEIICPHSL